MPFMISKCNTHILVQTTMRNTPATNSVPKRASPQTSSSAATTTIPTPNPRPNRGSRALKGASSISSNAYFGRPEDDIPQADEYGNYGDLEGAARDFVRKFGVTAGDDLENLTNVLGRRGTEIAGCYPKLSQWDK